MRTATGVLLLVLASGRGAQGQVPADPHGFLVVNGTQQLTTNDFRDGAVRRENAEDGRLDVDYTVGRGAAFDVAAGAALWGRLGLGVGLSRFTSSMPVAVRGSIPHPFFFDRPRVVAGETELTREELTVDLQVRGIFPVGTRVQVMVFGGPSVVRVTQEVVTDFTYTESYPYDEARFGAATTRSSRASAIGINAGGDLAFFFTRELGLGATLQYSGATLALPAAGDATRDVKAGGLKAGMGLRLRF